ncbi:hypothetical protein Tco_0502988 [Tanacetum coccineum]
MSSASFAVTYTSVYTDSDPGRPVAPPSPDYIPGPKEPPTPPVLQDEDKREPMFIQPHDPDYVPETMYPEYIPLEDEHVFLAKEQPLPPVVSPTAESPGYVVELDPEEYEDDETEDGPVDYPMDGGEDGEDDDGDSLGDDANEEDEDEEDEDEEEEEEEEKHIASADFAVVVLTIELVSHPNPDTQDSLHSGPYPTEAVPKIAPMTMGEVNTRVTELAVLHEHDTHNLYALLEDDQDTRTRISQRVTMDSQQVDLVMEDRIAHQETVLIIKEEAYASREA